MNVGSTSTTDVPFTSSSWTCISCASLGRTHRSHDHPLTWVRKKASFDCDACGETGDRDSSYLCTTCNYWIHSTCASLQGTIQSVHHDHPLLLDYSLPHEYRKFQFSCDICRQKFHELNWVYYCANCRFFSHIKCAKSERGTEAEVAEENVEQHLLHFPLPLGSLEVIINHFVKSICPQQNNEVIEPIRFHCHNHPLVIFNENNSLNDDMMEKNTVKTLCKACVHPISSVPFYGCGQCNFFLHKSCAMLPILRPWAMQFPDQTFYLYLSHSRPIVRLQTASPFFWCNGCCKLSTGFSYNRDDENCCFDVGCASLPHTIKHKAHRHPLSLDLKKPNYECNGCGSQVIDSSSLAFECRHCRYSIESYCARLPPIVKHEWDRHPLNLSYPPFSDHPDEFICEICEEYIHPKYWLYHCRYCDHSFHTRCVCPEDKYSNIQFGSEIVLNDHPHNTKFVRIGKKNKSPCIRCGRLDLVEGCPALRCEECNDQTCIYCICNSIPKEDPHCQPILPPLLPLLQPPPPSPPPSPPPQWSPPLQRSLLLSWLPDENPTPPR